MDGTSKNNALFAIQSEVPVTVTATSLQLSSRVLVLPQRTSLVKFAQACSLKRAHGSTSLHSLQLKAAKTSASGAKHTYKNRVPVRIVSSNSLQLQSASSTDRPAPVDDGMCPYAFIDSMVSQRQRNGEKRPALRPLHASEFPPPTAAQIAAYGHDALVAVRANDLTALRDLHRDGGPDSLGCRNQFGESLLHAACRRADATVVAFLLDEAGASPLVMDDYGRTPLHDACWRGKPAFAVVEALLRAEPRLAYVADVRGHRPFQYARREHWGVWNQFLAQKRDLIL